MSSLKLNKLINLLRWQRIKPLLKQFLSFGIVGFITLIGNGILFYILRLWLETQIANFVTLIFMTILNSYLNKRFTFKDAGKDSLRKTTLVNLTSFGIYWATTGGSLFALNWFFPTVASPGLETFVVILASGIGTILKFLLFRQVYFTKSPIKIGRKQVLPTDKHTIATQKQVTELEKSLDNDIATKSADKLL